MPSPKVALDKPDTYGGVLTGPAAIVVATLLALIAVAAVGWKARDLVAPAEAATKRADPATLEEKVDKIGADLGEVKTDIAVIKRQLGLDGLAPPPLRASGVGR